MTTIDADITAADEGLRAAHGGENPGDPYPGYARMRAAAPLYRSGLDGLWYATTYDDCKALLSDPRLGIGRFGVRYGVHPAAAASVNRGLGTSMLLQNPPEHSRTRALANKAFTPRRVATLRAGIRTLAEAMVARLAETGELMSTVAYPLPVTVIGELIGVPADEREQLRGAWNATFAASAPGAGPEVIEGARAADVQIEQYFAGLVARKRARPEDDLLSGLIEARDSNGALSEVELLAMLRLLFLAGYVTTTHLIGNGLYHLLRHPAQRDLLWAEPGRAPAAVEEMLRFDSPVLITRRVALEAFEHRGAVISQGDDFCLVTAAANRDPARFADPDRFDITRADAGPLTPVLSFAYGIHHCIGRSPGPPGGAGCARVAGGAVRVPRSGRPRPGAAGHRLVHAWPALPSPRPDPAVRPVGGTR